MKVKRVEWKGKHQKNPTQKMQDILHLEIPSLQYLDSKYLYQFEAGDLAIINSHYN